MSLAAAASVIDALERSGRDIATACDTSLLIIAGLSITASSVAMAAWYVLARRGAL